MKALVVYYSFEGNTRFIAEQVAESIDADITEIKPRDEIKAKGLMKFFWGGKQVMTGKKPELLPMEKDPGEYDVLFIGTPIWAFTCAPAMKSFLAGADLKGKRIALFCCCGGGKGKAFDAMRSALPGNEFLGETVVIEPLRSGRDAKAEQARQWARSLLTEI